MPPIMLQHFLKLFFVVPPLIRLEPGEGVRVGRYVQLGVINVRVYLRGVEIGVPEPS